MINKTLKIYVIDVNDAILEANSLQGTIRPEMFALDNGMQNVYTGQSTSKFLESYLVYTYHSHSYYKVSVSPTCWAIANATSASAHDPYFLDDAVGT